MKTILACVTALTVISGAAMAQSYDSTTTQQTTVAPPPPPAPGILSTTRTTHAEDAYGNSRSTKSTVYRDPNGVATESQTTTQQVAPPPPPPTTTTTSTTQWTSQPR
jgi:hypothetical protein